MTAASIPQIRNRKIICNGKAYSEPEREEPITYETIIVKDLPMESLFGIKFWRSEYL